MRSIVYIFFCLVTLSSCRKEAPYLERFESGDDINQTIISSPELIIDYPPRVIKVNDWLIASRFKGEYVFTGFNLSTEQLINFGKRGSGPGEFYSGYGLQYSSENEFHVYERERKTITFFQVNSDSIIELEKKKFTPFSYDVFPIDRKSFLSNGGGTLSKRYGIIDLKLDTLSEFIDYPSGVNDGLTNQGKSRVYFNFITKKPNEPKYAVITENHHIIDILLVKDNKIHLKHRNVYGHYEWTGGRRPFPGENSPSQLYSAKMGSSEESFFLYFEELNELNETDIQPWILEFDWKGNPQKKYGLSQRLKAMTYKDDTFWGIALKNNRHVFVSIKLPSNLKK